jgi:RNA polymerase sigma factor (sigma-70 family)
MRDGRGIPPFQAFFDQHGTLVHRFLVASVGPNEADDCFQETFLAALRAYPNLRNGDNLRAWVMAIAANKAIDAGRGRSRRPRAVDDLPEGRPAFDGTSDRAAIAEPFDARDPLWTAVRALPERMRTALVLRHVLDRPYEEVAAVMGSTEDAARANVHQALKRLRASLGQPATGGGDER